MRTHIWLAIGLINALFAVTPAIAHPHRGDPYSFHGRKEMRMERRHDDLRKHHCMERRMMQRDMMRRHWRMQHNDRMRPPERRMKHERFDMRHEPMMDYRNFEMRPDMRPRHVRRAI